MKQRHNTQLMNEGKHSCITVAISCNSSLDAMYLLILFARTAVSWTWLIETDFRLFYLVLSHSKITPSFWFCFVCSFSLCGSQCYFVYCWFFVFLFHSLLAMALSVYFQLMRLNILRLSFTPLTWVRVRRLSAHNMLNLAIFLLCVSQIKSLQYSGCLWFSNMFCKFL